MLSQVITFGAIAVDVTLAGAPGHVWKGASSSIGYHDLKRLTNSRPQPSFRLQQLRSCADRRRRVSRLLQPRVLRFGLLQDGNMGASGGLAARIECCCQTHGSGKPGVIRI